MAWKDIILKPTLYLRATAILVGITVGKLLLHPKLVFG